MTKITNNCKKIFSAVKTLSIIFKMMLLFMNHYSQTYRWL
ncbi:hypothetical protein HMPREF9103_00474 [Lentilactobacillus parafarraginis F0439]|uniref:Uncharacterized protein n=1 Tax=Lentilactobacillus parafarraginis F0439 TaxID=797515 RepID=G9ZL76_9LACO|nr:hypothetical protein HMPREF9103_00474 [Lentilactobacillus parafarraginis F0439]